MSFFSAWASSFSVFSLCLARSSFCMENGENSEKSNHIPSATSHSGLEFFDKISEHVQFAKSLFENCVFVLTVKFPITTQPSGRKPGESRRIALPFNRHDLYRNSVKDSATCFYLQKCIHIYLQSNSNKKHG